MPRAAWRRSALVSTHTKLAPSAAARAPIARAVPAAFSGAIVSYFKMPTSWDVPGLSEAFSPNYAEDAWVSRT